MLIGILGWIIIGLIAGFAATRIFDLRGDDPRLGLGLATASAVVGGLMYATLSGNSIYPFDLWGLLAAALAAAVGLVVWHWLRYRAAEAYRRRQPRGRSR